MTKAKHAHGARLQLSPDLSLPADAVTQTFGVVAKKRSGKSYFARRLAEQLHHCGQQVVVVDPKGDWWGILSSPDGRHAGLPFVIVGGERGHVPLEPSGGEVVASLVVEDRVSCLIDLSLLRKHEISTFMATFLEAVYRRKAIEKFRTPVMLVIDEADAIAPQKPQPNEARMLGAASDIVRRGGQRGIGCVMVTQRTAVLSKDVLTQVQILVALRTISPQDLTAMNAWIDVHGTNKERKTLMASLPSLPLGDAWVWSPGWPTDAGIFQRIHTAPIETFDSGATPKPGEKRIEPKKLADVDLEAVKKQMAATIERAKQDDPRWLRQRIAELEAERDKKGVKTQRVEVPALDTRARSTLEKAITQLEKSSAVVSNAARDYARDYNASIDTIEKVVATVRAVLNPAIAPLPTHRPASAAAPTRAPSRSNGANGSISSARPPVLERNDRDTLSVSGKGELLTLRAVAQHAEGTERELLTLITGYKKSTRDLYLQRLRARDYVTIHDGRVHATAAGLALLGPDFERLPTGAALRAYCLERLPEGERRMFEILLGAYPAPLTRDELSEAAGYKKSTRDLYLQRLATRQLIENQRDGVTASPRLFS